MKNFKLQNWHIFLGIETLFGGSIIAILCQQIGIPQTQCAIGFPEVEAMFLIMVVSFIIGIGMGIYYNKGE